MMDIKIINWTMKWLFLFVSICLLQGCASSDPSRATAKSIDNAYEGFSASLDNFGKGSITDSYQNSNQTSKGLMIGGLTGGLIGGMSNGIGALPGLITGAILGGSLGAYIDAHSSLVDRLKNRGAKVYILGDQVMIVLFSNRMFYDNTPNIHYDQYSTLCLVAQLIGHYANITVKVAGFTSSNQPQPVAIALSQQQANNVAKYLWKQGVNTRMLYSIGYGGTHLVMPNSNKCALNDNDRIEITFEKLPV